MSVVTSHSSVKYFPFPYEEEAVKAWSSAQVDNFQGSVTFGLLLVTPECLDDIEEIMEVVRIYGHVPILVGCCAHGVIAGAEEMEDEAGFTVSLYAFPETVARVCYLSADVFNAGGVDNRHLKSALGPLRNAANSWLLYASAVNLSGDSWLQSWDRAVGNRVTVGGFASSDPRAPSPALFYNGKAYTEGVLALALEGRVCVEAVVSQGCRPVGSPWIVTEADHNVIRKIGNRPILEVLRDTLEGMSRRDQKLARGNIFIGLVLDEYKPTFGTGDFIVRNLAAIDPALGSVTIATPPKLGQNLQFQIRDASTASIDFEQLLKLKAEKFIGHQVYGACVFDCIGRGSALYSVPDHDACLLQEIFPELPMSGLFCNGEFGPSRGRTLLHGYAASVALFIDQKPEDPASC